MDGTILIADDDRSIRTVLTQALTRAGCKVHATASLSTLMRWLAEGKGDLVISDVLMPDGNGLVMLPQIRVLYPDLPVIIISAQNTIVTAIQAAENDAFDYLPKPFDLPNLMNRISKGLKQKRRRRPALTPQTSLLPHPPESPTDPPPVTGPTDGEHNASGDNLPLLGRSPQMQALYKLIARTMNGDLPVIITGESGTGKSLIARMIHDFSDRRIRPFVTLHSMDLTPDTTVKNIVQSALGGTLVLDELGDYDDNAQLILVQLLDHIEHIAQTQRALSPRVIVISHTDLRERLAHKTLRDDLFYRLNGIRLEIPPLRERLEDISLLAQHFLAQGAQGARAGQRSSHRDSYQLLEDAQNLLRAQPWPGNVRQLENLMRRLSVINTAEHITAAEIKTALTQDSGTSPVMPPQKPGGQKGTQQPQPHAITLEGGLAESVRRHIQRYFDLHGHELPAPGVYQRILPELEIPLIEIALDASAGNQAKCAELLGINRNTLRKKINEHDIRVTRRRKIM